jgi:hypothetical protein
MGRLPQILEERDSLRTSITELTEQGAVTHFHLRCTSPFPSDIVLGINPPAKKEIEAEKTSPTRWARAT